MVLGVVVGRLLPSSSDTLIHPFSKGEEKEILSVASYFPEKASVYLASQNPFSLCLQSQTSKSQGQVQDRQGRPGFLLLNCSVAWLYPLQKEGSCPSPAALFNVSKRVLSRHQTLLVLWNSAPSDLSQMQRVHSWFPYQPPRSELLSLLENLCY